MRPSSRSDSLFLVNGVRVTGLNLYEPDSVKDVTPFQTYPRTSFVTPFRPLNGKWIFQPETSSPLYTVDCLTPMITVVTTNRPLFQKGTGEDLTRRRISIELSCTPERSMFGSTLVRSLVRDFNTGPSSVTHYLTTVLQTHRDGERNTEMWRVALHLR